MNVLRAFVRFAILLMITNTSFANADEGMLKSLDCSMDLPPLVTTMPPGSVKLSIGMVRAWYDDNCSSSGKKLQMRYLRYLRDNGLPIKFEEMDVAKESVSRAFKETFQGSEKEYRNLLAIGDVVLQAYQYSTDLVAPNGSLTHVSPPVLMTDALGPSQLELMILVEVESLRFKAGELTPKTEEHDFGKGPLRLVAWLAGEVSSSNQRLQRRHLRQIQSVAKTEGISVLEWDISNPPGRLAKFDYLLKGHAETFQARLAQGDVLLQATYWDTDPGINEYCPGFGTTMLMSAGSLGQSQIEQFLNEEIHQQTPESGEGSFELSAGKLAAWYDPKVDPAMNLRQTDFLNQVRQTMPGRRIVLREVALPEPDADGHRPGFDSLFKERSTSYVGLLAKGNIIIQAIGLNSEIDAGEPIVGASVLLTSTSLAKFQTSLFLREQVQPRFFKEFIPSSSDSWAGLAEKLNSIGRGSQEVLHWFAMIVVLSAVLSLAAILLAGGNILWQGRRRRRTLK